MDEMNTSSVANSATAAPVVEDSTMDVEDQANAHTQGAESTTNDENAVATTAVSIWFSKPPTKGHRRYGTVALWSYQASTKKLHYALWKDQGPAPYLNNLTSWITSLQPSVVYVSCAGGKESMEQDKNLCLWMQDIERDLQQQQQYQQQEPGADGEDEAIDGNANSREAQNLSRVVPTVVPLQIHKDGVEILRALVQEDDAQLYQLKANSDLTVSGEKAATPPLLLSAAVLLQAVGLYQTATGGALHPYLGQQDSLNGSGSFSIQPMPATNYMVLDRAAASSLNVWPISHAGQAALEGATAWHTSLYGLLAHYTRTPMGKTQLRQWLLHPLIQLAPLQERQDAVAYLVENGLLRQGLVDEGLQNFAGFGLEKLACTLESYEDVDIDVQDEEEEEDDLNKYNAKNQSFVGSSRKALQAIYELYLVASSKAPVLVQQLQPLFDDAQQHQLQQHPTDATSPPPNLLMEHAANVMQQLVALEGAAGLCEAVLDLDQAPREFVVKPSHTERLTELAEELAQWQSELDDCHQEMNELWRERAGLPSNNGAMYVRLHIPEGKTTMTYDYQFRLPNTNDSKKLQEDRELKRAKITVHRLLKNGVYFCTPQLKQLASQRAALDRELDRHQRSVVAKAISVASTYSTVIQKLRRSVAFLDGVAAMAQLAIYSSAGYCRPILTDSNEDGHGIVMQEARHPCVERQEDVEFIPNNIDLTLGKNSCWLTTGPNMGGKSTFIRSVGACVLLAQVGSYIPCESATINLVHSISARVGAGDLQDRGISTFMSEMLEASAILQTAKRRSLLIVDELGRGTSTFDGYGISRAICEYIVEKIQCLTVFATHFHELTASLPAQFPNGEIHNCHVSAVTNDNELVFLYKVEDGPCLQSFGIQVAEMAQVPKQTILDAKAKLRDLEAASAGYQQDSNENNKRLHSENNAADEEYTAKFQRLDIPKLLQGSDDDAIQKALLEALEG